MENEVMDLEQLAAYLRRDVREVSKLANRGRLPGKKVGGQWRFAPAEINYWMETQLPALSDEELEKLEHPASAASVADEPLVSSLLTESTIAVPLNASTKPSVLREVAELAGQSWQIYDTGALHEAVKHREDLGSTALESGVAIPHPHRPLSPKAQGDSVIAFARTDSGIPFGAPDGGLTDLFFLVSCTTADTHLRVLARLSRMFLRVGFCDELRSAATVQDALQIVERAERSLVGY
jgi:PTS system nitrogen regulatory IIA component